MGYLSIPFRGISFFNVEETIVVGKESGTHLPWTCGSYKKGSSFSNESDQPAVRLADTSHPDVATRRKNEEPKDSRNGIFVNSVKFRIPIMTSVPRTTGRPFSLRGAVACKKKPHHETAEK